MQTWNEVKTFSATKAEHRQGLGEAITDWLKRQRGLEVVDKVVAQSSDNEYHCLTVVLFCRRGNGQAE